MTLVHGVVHNIDWMHIGMLEWCVSERRASQQQSKNNTQEDGGESLSHLYREKALRYGIVFDELVRQVAVHSMDLATLVGKVHSTQ